MNMLNGGCACGQMRCTATGEPRFAPEFSEDRNPWDPARAEPAR